MPVLADILSYIDQKKRLIGRNLSDLVENPSAVIDQWNDQFREDLPNMVQDPSNYIGGGASGGVAAIFAGKGAKTANIVKQSVAEKMLKAGDDPAKVWKETGWGIGPDGKWRFEIPDNTANLKNMKASGSVFKDWPTPLTDGSDLNIYKTSGNASDVMSHTDLWNAYPDVATYPAEVTQSIRAQPSGAFYPGENKIVAIGNSPKSSTLHELQHAIQQREGFARGGSLESAEAYLKSKSIELEELSREIQKRGMYSPEEIDDMANQINIIRSELNKSGGLAGDVYNRLAGEAEARLTQSRMRMDAAQRSSQYPWDHKYFQKETQVPLSDLIFKYE